MIHGESQFNNCPPSLPDRLPTTRKLLLSLRLNHHALTPVICNSQLPRWLVVCLFVCLSYGGFVLPSLCLDISHSLSLSRTHSLYLSFSPSLVLSLSLFLSLSLSLSLCVCVCVCALHATLFLPARFALYALYVQIGELTLIKRKR
jgi:hypothetical protein